MDKPSNSEDVALRWHTLSSGAKAWVWCILLFPFGTAIIIRVLPSIAHAWIIVAIEVAVCCAILALSYMAFRWVFDRGGAGWLWRLDFLIKRLIARFSGEPGQLWMKWAWAAKDHRLAKAALEKAAQCGNADGLYEWGRVCKGELREDSARVAFLGAAQQGHLEASYEMGEATRWGRYYMQVDRNASRKWHE